MESVLSMNEYLDAAERGRRMALAAIMTDPESKRRVEDAFGVEHCRRRYPEAYVNTRSK